MTTALTPRGRPAHGSTPTAPRRSGGERTARVLFALQAAVGALVGGWAEFAPRSFYRDFPGLDRHWLPPLGPYNEHLIRDIGGLNLGLGTAALVASLALTRSVAVCVAAGWLVYAVPHLVFHLMHAEPYPTADNVADVLALGIELLLTPLAAWLVWRAPDQST